MTHAKPDSPHESPGLARRVATFVKRAAVVLLSAPLHVYRYAISPMLPPRCRFHPTCSDYAIQALRGHGPLAGSWLAFSRVCRCHPLSDGGVDPVPETFSFKLRGGRWPAALRDDPPARTD